MSLETCSHLRRGHIEITSSIEQSRTRETSVESSVYTAVHLALLALSGERGDVLHLRRRELAMAMAYYGALGNKYMASLRPNTWESIRGSDDKRRPGG